MHLAVLAKRELGTFEGLEALRLFIMHPNAARYGLFYDSLDWKRIPTGEFAAVKHVNMRMLKGLRELIIMSIKDKSVTTISDRLGLMEAWLGAQDVSQGAPVREAVNSAKDLIDGNPHSNFEADPARFFGLCEESGFFDRLHGTEASEMEYLLMKLAILESDDSGRPERPSGSWLNPEKYPRYAKWYAPWLEPGVAILAAWLVKLAFAVSPGYTAWLGIIAGLTYWLPHILRVIQLHEWSSHIKKWLRGRTLAIVLWYQLKIDFKQKWPVMLNVPVLLLAAGTAVACSMLLTLGINNPWTCAQLLIIIPFHLDLNIQATSITTGSEPGRPGFRRRAFVFAGAAAVIAVTLRNILALLRYKPPATPAIPAERTTDAEIFKMVIRSARGAIANIENNGYLSDTPDTLRTEILSLLRDFIKNPAFDISHESSPHIFTLDDRTKKISVCAGVYLIASPYYREVALVHEMFHMTARQKAMIERHRRLGEELQSDYSLRKLEAASANAVFEDGKVPETIRIFSEKYKTYAAHFIQIEWEAYNLQWQYWEAALRAQGYARGEDYLDEELAKGPSSQTPYEMCLAIKRSLNSEGRLTQTFRLSLLNTYMKRIHAALKYYAQCEGVNIKNKKALGKWLMGWLTDPKYCGQSFDLYNPIPPTPKMGGGTIGKFETVDIRSVADMPDGRVEIVAYIKDIGSVYGRHTIIHGRRAPPVTRAIFDYENTDIPAIDDAINSILAEIRTNQNAGLIILDDDDTPLKGFGAAINGATCVALAESIFDDRIARLHELAHAANAMGALPADLVLSNITDEQIVRDQYHNKLEQHGFTPGPAPEAVRFHYAMRALQRQKFGTHDLLLTHVIRQTLSDIPPAALSQTKCVILDSGNVIMKYDYEKAADFLHARFGVSRSDARDLFINRNPTPDNPCPDNPVFRYENGTITETELLEQMNDWMRAHGAERELRDTDELEELMNS
ncbi:MAG: hypothetical protein ABH885_06195, partial [Candidatus Omnitrophota bacterium]